MKKKKLTKEELAKVRMSGCWDGARKVNGRLERCGGKCFLESKGGKTRWIHVPYEELEQGYSHGKPESASSKKNRLDDARRIKEENPALANAGYIDNLLKMADYTRKWIADMEKAGKTPNEDILRKFEYQQQKVVEAIREARKAGR